MNSHRLRNWVLLAALVLFIIALDQGTKSLVRYNLAVGEAWAPIPALSKIFTITHVQNTGVAFGQLPGLGWLFMVVNLAVLVFVLFYYPRIPAGQWPMRLALILILSGDLGNIIDRLRTAFDHCPGHGERLDGAAQGICHRLYRFQDLAGMERVRHVSCRRNNPSWPLSCGDRTRPGRWMTRRQWSRINENWKPGLNAPVLHRKQCADGGSSLQLTVAELAWTSSWPSRRPTCPGLRSGG